MRGRATGFTLMELLIAIAIILVLAGILFPIVRGARVRADAATCLNNIRQIGVALQMYAGDWDGCAPPYTTYDLPDQIIIGSGETPEVWELPPLDDAAALKRCFAPYGAGGDEVWFCPLDPHAGGWGDPEGPPMDHTQTSYNVPPIFAVQRPVKLDDPPVISAEAYERMVDDARRPWLLYWVTGDDLHGAWAPHYLTCCNVTVYHGPTGRTYTIPHGRTYPMLLLDGSVVHMPALAP